MADEADLAFDSEQRHLTHSLAAQRQRGRVLQPAGCCHFCGNSADIQQRLFCDADCATDWEYQASVRRKLGLPTLFTLPPGATAPAVGATP
jgi:hypothetical protein